MSSAWNYGSCGVAEHFFLSSCPPAVLSVLVCLPSGSHLVIMYVSRWWLLLWGDSIDVYTYIDSVLVGLKSQILGIWGQMKGWRAWMG